MSVTESVQNFSQLCILLYMVLHTWDIFYGTLGGISFVVHTLWKLFKWTLIQQNTFFTHSDLSVGETEHKWVGCSLQCIKVQMQYTVIHNTIKCHTALCYKFQFIRTIIWHPLLKNITALATYIFFVREISLMYSHLSR